MPFTPAIGNLSVAEKNRVYYDAIANDYDIILDNERTNETIRNAVEKKFKNVAATGWVLDFGGGTGRDLDWLITGGYKVIFCEPSEAMRAKAAGMHKNNSSVLFLNSDQSDFTTWHKQPPFSIKTDSILADFAVFNCIDNIGLLFKTLSQVIKPGGSLVTLMLKHGYNRSMSWKLRKHVKFIISRKSTVINIRYRDYRQIVYVYSINEIKQTSAPYFDLCSSEDMAEFTLFHFIKK